jgi:hypothetical protein
MNWNYKLQYKVCDFFSFAEDLCLLCDLIVYFSFRTSVANVTSFVPLLLPVLSIKIAVVGSVLLSCM